MRYASVCSGVEAASVAWEPLFGPPLFVAEIEPFPCEVIRQRLPGTLNLGDMTAIDGAAWRGKVDVLIGGTPCQPFSIAGARAGLDDDRGQITLSFVEIVHAIQPKHTVWENVPGVFTQPGNPFGCFVGGLVGASSPVEPPRGKWRGAGMVAGPKGRLAWRTLDAEHFGLAQLRSRVFVVFCPRGGADPSQVLFEPEGVQRHTEPNRKAKPKTARHDGGRVKHPRTAIGFNGIANPHSPGDMSPCFIGRGESCVLVMDTMTMSMHSTENISTTLNTKGGRDIAILRKVWVEELQRHKWELRQVTPLEGERLMGLPDNWTQIPWRGKPESECPVGRRNKAIGNSFPVPVIRWIGERIVRAESASPAAPLQLTTQSGFDFL